MQAFSCDYCKSEAFRKKESFTHHLGIQDTKSSVIQCKSCKLVSLFPLPTETELEFIYNKYADKKGRVVIEQNWAESVYPLRLKKLRSFSQGDRLLDIGAGLGTFVSMAIECGFDAIGIEYEKDQCKKAQELFGVHLFNDKIENVYQDFRDLDVVNMHHVLEHVHSPRKIFDIVHEVLKPGGIVCFEVPNQFSNIIGSLTRAPINSSKKPLQILATTYIFLRRKHLSAM